MTDEVPTPASVARPGRWRLLWYGLAVAMLPLGLAAYVVSPKPVGPHAQGHYIGITIFAAQVVVLCVAAFLVRRHLHPLALLALALPLGAIVAGMAFNIAATRLIWNETWTDDTVVSLGPTIPGFERWHDLSTEMDLLIVAGGLVFAIAVLVSGRAGRAAPMVAAVLAFSPPWMLPALGSSFLLGHVAARKGVAARAPAAGA